MFISGRLNITIANTPTPLVPRSDISAARRITNITVQAPSTNATPVYIGGADVVSTPAGNTTGIELAAGASESFSATDATDIFVAGAAGDAVRFRAKAM